MHVNPPSHPLGMLFAEWRNTPNILRSMIDFATCVKGDAKPVDK